MTKPQDKLCLERMDAGKRALVESALEALPVVPERAVLAALIGAAMNFREPPGVDLWKMGKRLQHEHDGIPGKTEFEVAAGLWSLVRNEIIAQRASASS